MSQAGVYISGVGPGGPITTLTGNTGGAVPPTGGNINTIGSGNITVTGSPGTSTLTATLVGTTNHAVQVGNASGSLTSLAVGATGEGLMGNTGADPSWTGSPSFSGTVTAGTGFVATTGDFTATAGDFVSTAATNSTLTTGALKIGGSTADKTVLHTFDSNAGGTSNIFGGYGSGNPTGMSIFSTSNVGIGTSTLHSLTNGASNTALGSSALFSLTTGIANTAVGSSSLLNEGLGNSNTAVGNSTLSLASGGSNNTAIGDSSMGAAVVTGSNNTAVGKSSLSSITSGASNIAVGTNAATAYVSSESSNIIIGNVGSAAESNTIRLGTTGSGTGQQNRCFIAGIDGVSVGSTAQVVTEVSGQLGSAVLTAGANITITPTANVITIAANATSQVANYVTVNHAASPYTVLATDYYISADVTGGVVSILLPDAPTTGRTFVVKDKVGLAATSNITITTVGGVVTIDGSTSFVMNTAYESVELIFNGTSYEVY